MLGRTVTRRLEADLSSSKPTTWSSRMAKSTGGSGGRVVGHAAIYVLGSVAQSALGILLLPIVTRVLGVGQYGIVGTAAALSSLLVIVYGLGLNFAVTRFYYDEAGDAP